PHKQDCLNTSSRFRLLNRCFLKVLDCNGQSACCQSIAIRARRIVEKMASICSSVIGPPDRSRPLRIVQRRDTLAGGVEDVHVLSRRSERHPLAGRRRFSTSDLGNEQPVIDATHMGEGGFAKPRRSARVIASTWSCVT